MNRRVAVSVGQAEVEAYILEPPTHGQVPRLRAPLNGVAAEIVGGIESTTAATTAATIIIVARTSWSYQPLANVAMAFPHGVPGRADAKERSTRAYLSSARCHCWNIKYRVQVAH